MNDKALYWLRMCDKDLIGAKALLEVSHYLGVGFYCHLIVEKSLKAMISESTNKMPPKIHKLSDLAKRAGIYQDLSVTEIKTNEFSYTYEHRG